MPDAGIPSGVSLLEVLISLTILSLGVLALLSLFITARQEAEAAARHAARALAARQVLESHLVGVGPSPPSEGVVSVGLHRVRVTLTAEPAAGLSRIRSLARTEGEERGWILESLEAGP